MSAKSVLILDIDNTLNSVDPQEWVKKGHALGYDTWDPRQWTLYEEVIFDVDLKPHPIPHSFYKLMKVQYDEVAVVTSRIDSFLWRVHTEAWLQKCGFHYNHLLMRPKDQTHVPSKDMKIQLIEPFVSSKQWDVSRSAAIDDDVKVIEAYREIGIKTFTAPDEWERAIQFHHARRREFHRDAGNLQP